MYKKLLLLLMCTVNVIQPMSKLLAIKKSAPQIAFIAASAKHGYDMHRDEQNGVVKPMESLAGLSAIFYWTTKITLWTATVVTAGAAVKGGAGALKGESAAANGAVAATESLANSSVKFASGYGLATCGSELVAAEAFAWGGGPATGIPAAFAVPALSAAATANPETAGYFTEAATATTFSIAMNPATATAGAAKAVTAKSIIVSAASSYAATIESAAVAAGTVGMWIPWF